MLTAINLAQKQGPSFNSQAVKLKQHLLKRGDNTFLSITNKFYM